MRCRCASSPPATSTVPGTFASTLHLTEHGTRETSPPSHTRPAQQERPLLPQPLPPLDSTTSSSAAAPSPATRNRGPRPPLRFQPQRRGSQERSRPCAAVKDRAHHVTNIHREVDIVTDLRRRFESVLRRRHCGGRRSLRPLPETLDTAPIASGAVTRSDQSCTSAYAKHLLVQLFFLAPQVHPRSSNQSIGLRAVTA